MKAKRRGDRFGKVLSSPPLFSMRETDFGVSILVRTGGEAAKKLSRREISGFRLSKETKIGVTKNIFVKNINRT